MNWPRSLRPGPEPARSMPVEERASVHPHRKDPRLLGKGPDDERDEEEVDFQPDGDRRDGDGQPFCDIAEKLLQATHLAPPQKKGKLLIHSIMALQSSGAAE